MQKICIIGSGGAGKSTLSRKLGEVLNLPVYHLDTYFWKPGWIETPRSDCEKIARQLVSNEVWIIDGNFNGTFHIRFEAADTIIFLDYKRIVCVYHCLKRYFRYRGKTRPDLPEGCNESLDYKFYKWVWNFPKKDKSNIMKTLELFKDLKKIIILNKKKETDKFIKNLKFINVVGDNTNNGD